MTHYILQRLALLPALMLVYSFVIFVIIQAPPGDFLTHYVATLASSGSSISMEQMEALRASYGLDQPFIVQYWLWLKHLVVGDMGLSLEYQRPNAELIGEQLAATIALALFSFVLTWAIAVPAGIWCATHQRSFVDHLLTIVNYVGVATPNFMLALVLMWVGFAWFDISVTGLFSEAYVDAPWSFARVIDMLAHMWLPALVLAIAGTARLTRIMRANLLDELNKPYVTTARAKGLSTARVIWRHAFGNIAVRLITVLTLTYASLLEGAVVTETVFSWPGLGQYLTVSLLNADMNAVLGATLVVGMIYLALNLMADMLYRLIDPRVAA